MFFQSIFRKFTDSVVNLLPLNGIVKKENSDLIKTQPKKKNSRYASEVFSKSFSDDNEQNCSVKRPKLHHDRFSPPQSINASKINNIDTEINKSLNNAASELDDTSINGAQSIKRFNLNFSNQSFNKSQLTLSNNNMNNKTDDSFMSCSARRILDRLDRLTTPITLNDKILSSSSISKISMKYNPYSRKIAVKRKPIQTVTTAAVSSSVNNLPIKSVKESITKIGYFDDEDEAVDLDIKNVNPSLKSINKIDFSHLPLLTANKSTDTDDIDKISPLLDFEFNTPLTINSANYSGNINKNNDCVNQKKKFKFKPIITEKSAVCRGDYTKLSNPIGLWRCNTCFLENLVNIDICRGCSNMSHSNRDSLIFEEKMKKISDVDFIKQLNCLPSASIEPKIDSKSIDDQPISVISSAPPLSIGESVISTAIVAPFKFTTPSSSFIGSTAPQSVSLVTPFDSPVTVGNSGTAVPTMKFGLDTNSSTQLAAPFNPPSTKANFQFGLKAETNAPAVVFDSGTVGGGGVFGTATQPGSTTFAPRQFNTTLNTDFVFDGGAAANNNDGVFKFGGGGVSSGPLNVFSAGSQSVPGSMDMMCAPAGGRRIAKGRRKK